MTENDRGGKVEQKWQMMRYCMRKRYQGKEERICSRVKGREKWGKVNRERAVKGREEWRKGGVEGREE